MKTLDYWLLAGFIFIGLGLLDMFLDNIDPCHESHTDYCVEQIDYQPEITTYAKRYKG